MQQHRNNRHLTGIQHIQHNLQTYTHIYTHRKYTHPTKQHTKHTYTHVSQKHHIYNTNTTYVTQTETTYIPNTLIQRLHKYTNTTRITHISQTLWKDSMHTHFHHPHHNITHKLYFQNTHNNIKHTYNTKYTYITEIPHIQHTCTKLTTEYITDKHRTHIHYTYNRDLPLLHHRDNSYSIHTHIHNIHPTPVHHKHHIYTKYTVHIHCTYITHMTHSCAVHT